MSTPVRITKQDLEKKVEEGWKLRPLAEHYGLPVTQMTKALRQAGLTIRKFHKPKFELIDEEVVNESRNQRPFTEEELSQQETETPVTDINLESETQEINEEEIIVTEPEEVQEDIVAEVASINEESSLDW